MWWRLTGAEEGSGRDEAAAAAAGTSGDCGGGAPPPSTWPPSALTRSSPSSPPTSTPSSPSSPSPSPPQSPRSTPSSPSSANEVPGCDGDASAAAGTSGDSGGGAPRRSASPTPSTSSTSPPQSPTWTPSSSSSADEKFAWGEEQDVDPLKESCSSTSLSSTYSDSEEDEWGDEQKVDQLQKSLGTTSLNSTRSEIQDIENDDTDGVSDNGSKRGHKEIVWGEEQELDQSNESFGFTCLSSTHSDSDKLCHIFESDDNVIFPNKSKLGDKVPVLTLLEDAETDTEDETIIGQIMLLDEKYGSRRRTARDGSCFYRAFIFKYLENVVELKDEDERRAEAARLRRSVENYIPACYEYDAQLVDTFSGFESVVNLVEQVLPLLRALTEIEICTNPVFYHGFLIPGEKYDTVYELCLCEVRWPDGEANNMQVYALSKALGVPVILENLNRNTPVQLNPVYFYPLESEAEEPVAQVERDGPSNLSAAEQRRLVTLLYRPGHYDIIYPK